MDVEPTNVNRTTVWGLTQQNVIITRLWWLKSEIKALVGSEGREGQVGEGWSIATWLHGHHLQGQMHLRCHLVSSPLSSDPSSPSSGRVIRNLSFGDPAAFGLNLVS